MDVIVKFLSLVTRGAGLCSDMMARCALSATLVMMSSLLELILKKSVRCPSLCSPHLCVLALSDQMMGQETFLQEMGINLGLGL